VIIVAAALDELHARVAELRADLTFVALASQLRPRIGAVVQWQAAGDILALLKQFMNEKSSRPEGIYGPLLVGLLAAFERYLRMLVRQCVEHWASRAATYDKLSEKLSRRNLILTGRLLAAIETLPDHLTVDVESVVANLASCKRGSSSFRLNTQAFTATVTGMSPGVIERALEFADVPDCWDIVGANTALVKILGTKGARATGVEAQERLKELWRWRNHLAHGGDDEITISETSLRYAIDFVACFSGALDVGVGKVLSGS
jgi:hypothetical protein